MCRRPAQKTPVQISQEPDMMQHTFGQKLVFTKGYHLNKVSTVKLAGSSLDQVLSFWPHPNIKLEINVVTALQVDVLHY